MLGIGLFGPCEFDHFDFLKLVLADDAARVFARGTGLGAEAWRVGSERNGQARFVEKTAGLTEFKKGLAAIALGGTYFGPAAAGVLRNAEANPESGGSPDFLTDREREIVQLVAEGHSTKEIAAKLGISAKTVDNHRTNLMRKLNIHDVASLTRYAFERGLIDHKIQT